MTLLWTLRKRHPLYILKSTWLGVENHKTRIFVYWNPNEQVSRFQVRVRSNGTKTHNEVGKIEYVKGIFRVFGPLQWNWKNLGVRCKKKNVWESVKNMSIISFDSTGLKQKGLYQIENQFKGVTFIKNTAFLSIFSTDHYEESRFWFQYKLTLNTLIFIEY